MLVLEAVFLGQGDIVFLLFLDMPHIEVGLAEELGGKRFTHEAAGEPVFL